MPAQKWTTFYTKVLSRFANKAGLELRLKATFEVRGQAPPHDVDEARAALRELGLSEEMEAE